ncbi:Oidioi.mRNA.OKI2018_I69.XSR.g15984.t1.cds [Oikopleura dioica]|uniref:Oidioi.mRNA.OKI2018_I69.XSR.g15984.t1.cds n=1 Tax=Oikopleura dioica TaxID=34765 RepID=A0ABN7SGH7_OIKDI|nr:Oidioi.mRNA.OKI2018_I69.XSR.g15984.t1.cds [Oikopleura dioica]
MEMGVLANPVNGTMPHNPGMPHTPGINYVNGMAYLDLGTAPASVISRFSDYQRQFNALSHSLNELLARDSQLRRKYRFIQPADSRWLLPLNHSDASGMNSQLTDAVRRLDMLVVRQRLDSRAAALEELLLGDHSRTESHMNPLSDRIKFPEVTSVSLSGIALQQHSSSYDKMRYTNEKNDSAGQQIQFQSMDDHLQDKYRPQQDVQDQRMTPQHHSPYSHSPIPNSQMTIEPQITQNGAPPRSMQIGSDGQKSPSMVVKGQKKKFACHICGKEYNTKQYIKQHVQSVHKDLKDQTVTINNKTQLTQVTPPSAPIASSAQFMQKLHVCHADGCGMKFPTALLLQKHQRNVHGQQQPTQHMLSPQQNSHNGHSVTTVKHDSTQLSLQNGQNAVVAMDPSPKALAPFVPEEQQNMVECEECGKHVRETSLAAHKKRHELAAKRPFKCEICGKGFMRTVTLRDHMNTHNGVKPHKCKVCGRGWASRPNMLKHVREKHPEARIPPKSINGMNETIEQQAPPESALDIKTDSARLNIMEYSDGPASQINEIRTLPSAPPSYTINKPVTTIHNSPIQLSEMPHSRDPHTNPGDIQSILQRMGPRTTSQGPVNGNSVSYLNRTSDMTMSQMASQSPVSVSQSLSLSITEH